MLEKFKYWVDKGIKTYEKNMANANRILDSVSPEEQREMIDYMRSVTEAAPRPEEDIED